MKNNLKTAVRLTIICMVLLIAGCEKDLYEDQLRTGSYQAKMLTFKQFKEKTNMRHFETNIRITPTMSGATGKTIELQDFVIDTALVKELLYNNTSKYSFKILPLEEIENSKELYNLVYEYKNNEWQQTVYLLKELDQPTGDKQFESLEVVFSSHDTLEVSEARFFTCFGEMFTFHCTGTGPCATGVCDMCRLCVSRSITSGLCYQDDGLSPEPLYLANDGLGNGGGAASEIDPNATDEDCDGSIECASYNLYLEFKFTLTVAQRYYITTNTPESNAIFDYLSENLFDEQSKEYARQMIASMVNNDGYSGDGFLGDEDDNNEEYTGPTQHIPQQITLNDGTTVQVVFGTTASDSESADQEVATKVVEAIVAALNEANAGLTGSNKITSIYVKATTNGEHSATSNHFRGTAVDISRINGSRIINLGNNAQVVALQNAFDNYAHIRENFGPHFKHKTETDGSRNLNYPVGGHRDHIHISVQNN